MHFVPWFLFLPSFLGECDICVASWEILLVLFGVASGAPTKNVFLGIGNKHLGMWMNWGGDFTGGRKAVCCTGIYLVRPLGLGAESEERSQQKVCCRTPHEPVGLELEEGRRR